MIACGHLIDIFAVDIKTTSGWTLLVYIKRGWAKKTYLHGPQLIIWHLFLAQAIFTRAEGTES